MFVCLDFFSDIIHYHDTSNVEKYIIEELIVNLFQTLKVTKEELIQCIITKKSCLIPKYTNAKGMEFQGKMQSVQNI